MVTSTSKENRVSYIPAAPAACAEPGAGEVTQIVPGIGWARIPLPYAPHHVNCYILDDGDGWFLIDTGGDSPEGREHWQALLAGPLVAKPISRIFVTHWHSDHLGMAGWLAGQSNASVLMTEAEYQRGNRQITPTRPQRDANEERHLSLNGAEPTQLQAWLEDGFQNMSMISPLPTDYVHLLPDDLVKVGERAFRVVPLTGHSPQTASLWCADDKIFVCGDQLSEKIVPPVSLMADAPDANPLASFINTMDVIRQLIPEDAVVLPGHEMPFFGVQSVLQRQATRHMMVCNRLLAAAASPRTAGQLISVLSHNDPGPTWFGSVVGRAVAYATLLIGWGFMRQIDVGGTIYFVALDSREVEISHFLATTEMELTS
jgi:glyoxylase-like metal-dependent hydrolase (beta-lactamase superfamily II)